MTAADKPRFTFAQRLALAVAPLVVSAVLWVVSRTWRFEVIAEEGVMPVLFGEEPRAEIYCFWHQCVLPANVYFRGSHAVILISRSFDGELVTRVARIFGYDAVRGSSSRGAHQALLGLKNSIEAGRSAIFTADGPRGPLHQSKMGPIKLAQMTGAPIHAFHLQPERAWVLRSWDKFLAPKPFTRIVVSWARPVRVASDLPADQFELKRQQLDAAIERARLRALAHFNKADIRKPCA